MEIENTFWFRHFLMCNEMAKLMCEIHGWVVENFAECVLEEENGRAANSQMTVYFWQADKFLCDLHCSEERQVFEYLEEIGVSMKDLSELQSQEISYYYDKYCSGRIDFSNLIN